MHRRTFVAVAILVAGVAGWLVLGPARDVVAQGGDRARGVYITDPTDTTRAGPGVLAHISAVVHVVIQQGTGAGAGHVLTATTLVNSLAPRITIAHTTSVTHVSGLVSIRDDTCPTCKARVDHYNALANQPHISGALRAWQVSACGTTASLAVASNANRRDLVLKNLGGDAANSERNVIFVGFGATGHVALSTANGYPLAIHYAVFGGAATSNPTMVSTSPLVLTNYQGPIACVTNQNTAILSIIEVLR